MKKLLLVFITLVTGLTVGVANADVLDFDSITTDPFTSNLGEYGGLDWNNFGVGDGTRMTDLPNGYNNGTVSGSYVSYNWNANMATVSTISGTFDFFGAYLTGAWNNGLNIDVVGYAGGSPIYSQTVVVNTGGPTWFQFDYTGVDTVTFDSYGGTSAGLSSTGTHFAMDNFTYTPKPVVPEPGNCNGDDIVDAGDLTALVLEIFDLDGNLPADASGGGFAGTAGCDANDDNLIDAGDLTCTVLIIFNGPGACGTAP